MHEPDDVGRSSSDHGRMTVGLLSVSADPLTDTHARELATALARAGHEVTVWTRRAAADQPDAVQLAPRARVRHLAAGPPQPLSDSELLPHLPELAAALRAAWSDERPDVAHAHGRLSGLVMVAAGRDTGLPLVQSFPDGASRGWGKAAGYLVGHVDQVITTSGDEALRLARLGVSRSAVAVVPSGVDTETFCPGDAPVRRDGPPRLVNLSGWEPSAGADEAVIALAAVPRAELVVAGAGTDRDGARLTGLAERHGVQGRVHLVRSPARERVPALLRSSDVVICVPWFEQPAVAALEAMACARPVVASAVGGLSDTVVDGITGVHVPARAPRRLAGALRTLLGGPALREAFGVAGRDRTVARYSWERIADATAGIYRPIVDRAVTG